MLLEFWDLLVCDKLEPVEMCECKYQDRDMWNQVIECLVSWLVNGHSLLTRVVILLQTKRFLNHFSVTNAENHMGWKIITLWF